MIMWPHWPSIAKYEPRDVPLARVYSMYSTAPTSALERSGGTICGEGSAVQDTPSAVVPNPIEPLRGDAVQNPKRG